MKACSNMPSHLLNTPQDVDFIELIRELTKSNTSTHQPELVRKALSSWERIAWQHLPHEIGSSPLLWFQSDFEFSRRQLFLKALRYYTRSLWLTQYTHGALRSVIETCLMHLEQFEEAKRDWAPGSEAHDVFEEAAQSTFEASFHILEQDFEQLLIMSHPHTAKLSVSQKAKCMWAALLISHHTSDHERFRKFRKMINLFKHMRPDKKEPEFQSKRWQSAWQKYPLATQNRYQAMGKMVSKSTCQQRKKETLKRFSKFGNELGKIMLLEYVKEQTL